MNAIAITMLASLATSGWYFYDPGDPLRMLKDPVNKELVISSSWSTYTVSISETAEEIYYSAMFVEANNNNVWVTDGTRLEVLDISGSHNTFCFDGGSRPWMINITGDNNRILLPKVTYNRLRLRFKQFSSKEYYKDSGDGNEMALNSLPCSAMGEK